jgi:hypothetical protein
MRLNMEHCKIDLVDFIVTDGRACVVLSAMYDAVMPTEA